MKSVEAKIIDQSSAWKSLFKTGTNLLFTAALVAAVPLLVAQAFNLSAKAHFQFFPIAWIFFAAMVATRGRPAIADGMRLIVGMALFVLSCLVLIASIFLFSPWVTHAAAIGICFAWLLVCVAKTPWYQAVAWIALLLVTLPLPMNMDTQLVQQLQLASTKSASYLLDIIGTPHLATGNVLEVRTGKLFVDEACSGVDSLYALMAIALGLCVWQRCPTLQSLLILLSVPCWAWLGNVMRISLIAILLDRYGWDLSHGVGHTALGLGLFAISSFFVMATMSALDSLVSPFPIKSTTSGPFHDLYNWLVCWPGHDPARPRSSSSSKNAVPTIDFSAIPIRRIHVGLSSALFLIGVLSSMPLLGIGPWKRVSLQLPAYSVDEVKSHFTRELLPPVLMNMQCVAFDTTQRQTNSSFGEHSATWEYQSNTDHLTVSLDFPFPGHHALEGCYGFAGKRLMSSIREVETDGVSEASKIIIAEAHLQDELNEESLLNYSLFDLTGNPVRETSGTLNRGILLSSDLSITYQVQVHKDLSGPITDTLRAEMHDVLRDVVARLLPAVQKLAAGRE